MVIGACRIAIEFSDARSLKEKRGPLRSIMSRLRSTFNVAVAEVGSQDQWTEAVLGLAVVSSNARHANEMVDKIIAFVEAELSDGVVIDSQLEILHLADE
jgi:hypothetical protein